MGAPYIMDMLDALKKSSDQNKDIAETLNAKKNFRYALVGLGGATDKPYRKFASISISNASIDASITFKVFMNKYGDDLSNLGILTAHVRTKENGYWDYGELTWEYALNGITTSDFMLLHNTSTTPTIVELWTKLPASWTSCHFDVLSEETRVTTDNNLWTLYSSHGNTNAGGESSLPADMVVQESALGVLKNGITGTVNGHSINSDVPSNAKFTDTTYNNATQSANGLMSSSDKKKLDNIEDGAQKNVINVITVNGSKIEPQNGTVDLSIEDNDKLPLSGGEVTGNVQQSGASTDYSTYKFRNISFGTSSTPSSDATHGGSGSVYFMYT